MNKNKVIKNASWIIGCRIIQSLSGLIIAMLVARYLGPSNFGVINYAASVVAFFVPVMRLGLDGILVNELILHPEKEGEILGTSVVSCLITAIFSILGVICFVSIANAGDIETVVVCCLYSTVLFFQAFEIFQYWFQAKLLSKYTSIVVLIAYFLTTIYKAFLLYLKKEIFWFALSYTVDYLIIAIGYYYFLCKHNSSKLRFRVEIAKELLSKSKHYIIANLMVVVFSQIDRIILKFMIDDASVGYYSAAVTCAGMTGFVFSAIIDSLRPEVLKNKQDNQEKYIKSLRLMYSIVLYIAILQCLFITIFAKEIVALIYGIDYLPTIFVLQILVWYTIFSYLGALRNVWILAEGKQSFLWLINLSGAIYCILANLIFIKYMGVVGAAIAALTTQVFTNIITGFIIKPVGKSNYILFDVLKPRNFVEMFNLVRNYNTRK